ncbi:MAG: helix-turn-helix domain-containing protein [Oscillospiraceae bacterium]|nr:helix-turn-helix domain-containing protein [Oscillospiraceae bacterium]
MDCKKVGALLRQLRTERGMTQREIAERLFVSDKAVSKWERGLGCPDISALDSIADLFGVPVETLLSGELNQCGQNGGNMKRLKFYVCPNCGNIFTAASAGEISCCGRKLSPLEASAPDEGHAPKTEIIDDEFYVTFPHEMSKSHYITFTALAGCDRLYLHRLYPEQDAAARLPRLSGAELYFFCSEHGLMKVKL